MTHLRPGEKLFEWEALLCTLLHEVEEHVKWDRGKIPASTYLKVSSIIVKSTNLPRSGTTSDVGGMISASSKKKTVNERRIEMDSDT